MLLRAPDRQGYWHLVAGALDGARTGPRLPRASFSRKPGSPRRSRISGSASRIDRGRAAAKRAALGPGVTEIAVAGFVTEAPGGLGADARLGARGPSLVACERGGRAAAVSGARRGRAGRGAAAGACEGRGRHVAARADTRRHGPARTRAAARARGAKRAGAATALVRRRREGGQPRPRRVLVSTRGRDLGPKAPTSSTARPSAARFGHARRSC